jgi:hypothetical protein
MAYCTIEELAEELGYAVTASNTAKLTACADAAAQEIDQHVDRDPANPIPPDDPLAKMVNIQRGVEWWKASQAAFGIAGGEQTGALYTPKDGFYRHGRNLVPLKEKQGVA